MKTQKLRQFMQKNIREVTVWFMIGIIIMYIWFATAVAVWQKALVSAILFFGGFEAIAKMHGQESPGEKIKREFQKGGEEIKKQMEEQQADMRKQQESMRQGIQLPEFDLPDFGLGGDGRPRR